MQYTYILPWLLDAGARMYSIAVQRPEFIGYSGITAKS